MRRREPITQTVNVTNARAHWSRLLNEVFRDDARVIVEKSGIPVAAIVSADDLAHLERLEQERAERFRVIDRVRAVFADVPDEELEQQVERAVAAARAELRAEHERVTQRR